MKRLCRTAVQALLLISILACRAQALAAPVPPKFADALVASGLSNPTAMAFAPNGRLFVCLQGGQVRVIENGALLAAPLVTLTVNSSGERGFSDWHSIRVVQPTTTSTLTTLQSLGRTDRTIDMILVSAQCTV
jgi:glucose/arabinose dehydrogenase